MGIALERRRSLRQTHTDAERLLWNLIRNRQLAGFKFRRQHPSCGYILDFYCAELRVAIELDGGQHYLPAAQIYDAQRTEKLRNEGILVLRFQTDVVITETVSVLEEIARQLGIEIP